MSMVEKLGVWENDPRSFTAAQAIDMETQQRRTVAGRLESLVGRSDQQSSRKHIPMEATKEYPFR